MFRDRVAVDVERFRHHRSRGTTYHGTPWVLIENVSSVRHAGEATHDNDRPWRAEVLARIAVLQATAESVCPSAGGDGRDERRCARIEQLLEETKQQAQAKRNLRERWKDWRDGGPIERAWRNVHSAEILLAEVIGLGELSSQRPAVRSMAKRVLPAKDARSQAIEQWLSDKMWNKLPERDDTARSEKLRREYVASLTWVNDACDKNFTRVRSFRNVVLAASVGLAVVAIGLGAIGVLTPSSLPLCFDAGSLTADDTSSAKAARSIRSCARQVRSAVRRVATYRSCSWSASRPARSPPRWPCGTCAARRRRTACRSRSPGSSCLPER